ncbi:MAG: PD40 domain-containing protein [Anaerolineae bacterium]|nr:PD40 domain-containing protein [Anaerolineae bacterium]MCB0256472.1 PD40 domain-containing protein [Anaerolineae bacterium]
MSYQPPSNRRSNTSLWLGGAATLLVAVIAVLVLLINRQPAPDAPASAVIVSAASATAEPAATPTTVDTVTSAPTDTSTPTSTPLPELGISNIFIEYILDASGSMTETLSDGSPKIDVAQQVLTDHMRSFRPETNIGLRVYGHLLPYQQTAESCQDIELIAPPEKGQMERIVGFLQGFTVQGMTPLAASLEQAKDDFVYDASRVNAIVMLSDGIETCGGDPCQLVEGLKAQGVNFTIHVIGLDVDDPAREQLSCIAQVGDGTYQDARSQQELDAALGAIQKDVTKDEIVMPPGVDTPTPGPVGTLATALPNPSSVWSGKIAFLSDANNPSLSITEGVVGYSEIYVIDPNNGSTLQVTNDLRISGLGPVIGLEGRFTWSPLLKRFFFSTMGGSLISVSEDGYEQKEIETEFVSTFDVSPDGRTVAITTWRERPNVDVATIDINGTNMSYVLDEETRHQLDLAGKSSGNGPSWSPDGSRLAVNTSISGGLMIIDMASKSVLMPVTPPTWVMEPLDWSPDGQYLFVDQVQPGGDRRIRYIDLEDGSMSTLPIEGYNPVWSPDGTKIVYSDNDHQQLWIVNADGTEPKQLTFEGNSCCAVWIP